MSQANAEVIIRTGGDPREQEAFAQLRQQINNINHPARPDVNWGLIERLALQLFRSNGVDLQTATYYTLARTHLHGLLGFTEGCELLAGLLVSEWHTLWPEQTHARGEILEWFNGRVGSLLRQLDFFPEDLRLIYRAERSLQLITDKLQQVELKRLPRIENLLYFMQNTAQRLERSLTTPLSPEPSVQMAPLVYLPGSLPDAPPEPPPVYRPEVVTPTPTASSPAATGATRRLGGWQGFVLGVLTSALVGGASVWWWIIPAQPQQKLQQQVLMISPLSTDEVQAIRQQYGAERLDKLAEPLLTLYQQQLDTVARLSPLATLRYGDQIVSNAAVLWPTLPRQQALHRHWQELIAARGQSTAGSGYHQAQVRLQAIAEQLLDREQQGKSITISSLKSAIFDTQQQLNAEPPLEDLLRQLAALPSIEQGEGPALRRRIDDRFNTLLSRYYSLTPSALSSSER